MKQPTKISVLQFYLMLFVSRIVVSVTLNAQTVGDSNFLDNIFSSLLLFAALFLFVLPLFALNRKYPDASLPAIAERRLGGLGYGVSAVYGLYFVIMNTFSLSLFLMLVLNTIDPAAAKWSVAAILAAIALYGAVKGIETISRASLCIFTLFLLGMGVIFLALSPNIRLDYTEPMLYDGFGQTLRGFFVFAARCTSLAEFAVLMPFAEGNKKLGFALWNGGVTAFLALLLFFIVSCLGEYAYLQIFPAYTLSAIAEIAGIQRLDALFIGLCMMALIIRMACGLFAVSECISRVMRPRARTAVLAGISVLSVVLSLWITADAKRAGILFRTAYLLPLTVLTGAVLPVLVWLIDHFKKERGSR
ncbi:MAG: GerAB/ArcD/ProY family transporter [Hominenteromicrobium sp.]